MNPNGEGGVYGVVWCVSVWVASAWDGVCSGYSGCGYFLFVFMLEPLVWCLFAG